jgi:thiamine biosynthesis lipoprotein
MRYKIELTRLVIAVCVLFIAACGPLEPRWYSQEGETMGTTYHVQYRSTKNRQKDIDRLLDEINRAVSTYIPTSTISVFNNTGVLAIPLAENGEPQSRLHGHFFANLEVAYDVFKLSGGYFDPTVGPLVEAWGFGSDGREVPALDSASVSELIDRVGMQYLNLRAVTDTIEIRALKPGMHLDFSALAKGYAVDLLYNLLTKTDPDVFVEIGGEVRVGGQSPRGDDWVVGVSNPEEGAAPADFSARLHLRDAAMATSGNYRNFYIRDGRKVWHTINPKTGFPEENTLLSASIIHPRCIMADALATACMAMGTDDAIGMIWKVPGSKGFFIYRDPKGDIATFVTDNLKQDLLHE